MCFRKNIIICDIQGVLEKYYLWCTRCFRKNIIICDVQGVLEKILLFVMYKVF